MKTMFLILVLIVPVSSSCVSRVRPDGQPIVMLADHPTTGGYPVIGVVDPADIHHVAQAAIGTEVRFTASR